MRSIQQLLANTTTISETIPSHIFGTFLDYATPLLMGRQLVIYMGPDQCPGSTVTVAYKDKDSLTVSKTGEGASSNLTTATGSSTTLTPDKYTARIILTKELEEDSKFGMMDFEIQDAAYQMAKNEDTQIFSALQAATTNVITGGAEMTVGNITNGQRLLRDNDFSPSAFIVSPPILEDMQNTDIFVEANKAGTDETHRNGFMGRIYGMDVYVTNQANQSTTNDAFIVDPRKALLFAEKRPFTMISDENISIDAMEFMVSQRFAVDTWYEGAIAKITTTA